MTGPSPIQNARARHRLADVAQRTGIHLATLSGSLTVRCPLPAHGHPDRSPSMRLYLDDDRFYCFGCSAKGDVIDWVTQTERVSIPAALAILDSARPLANAWAGQAPQTHQPGRPEVDRTPPGRVLAALQAAWAHYAGPAGRAQAGAYLQRRGIRIDILEARTGRAEAGHTPQGATRLTHTLRAQGFSDDELVDAGLAQRHGDGTLTDFYRDRLLIPVRDTQHHVIGIIGRNTSDQGRCAKYKNPPRTAVYDKSVDLYQPLPDPAPPDGRIVVVEGTLDAIAVAVAAINARCDHLYCPVTQSGRELSPHQLRHVLDKSPNPPILAFDSDPAGQDSARRYHTAIANVGRQADIARLPAGHDPASWLAEHGADGLQALAAHHAFRDPERPPSNGTHTPANTTIRPGRATPAAIPPTRRRHVTPQVEPLSAQVGTQEGIGI